MWAKLKPMPRLSRRARRGLRAGTRIEREHVYSRRAAEAIAAQHLAERPDYYRRLMQYVENPGEIIRAGKDPFQENALTRKLQEYAWKKHGVDMPYEEARDAMRAMILKGIHAQFKVVQGGRVQNNPRHVLGGFHDLIPYAEKVEPRHIKGLRLGKSKVLLTIINDHLRVYEVDGAIIRNQWDEFLGGGNEMAYQFVPKNEVWVDSSIKNHWDRVCFTWHEIIELLLMKYKGWKYTKAHLAANQSEHQLRSYDRRMVGYAVFLDVVLDALMLHFGKGNLDKLLPMAEGIARGLNRI